jgi:hypothetical protein
MNAKRFIQHHGLFCLLLLIVCSSVVAYFEHWIDTKDIVPLSTLCITAVLAAITWQYVRTTQDTLAIIKKQWEYEQETGIAFGIKNKHGKPWVRIANTGGARLFLSKAVFHRRNGPPLTRISIRMIGGGSNYGFYVPSALYKSEPHNLDVDVTVHYQAYDKKERTVSRAFRIELLNGKAHHIKRGIHEWWTVPCPTCGVKLITMNTEKLENYTEAYKREAEMRSQLEVSCPMHQSPWMDTVESINERNRKEKEKGVEQ